MTIAFVQGTTGSSSGVTNPVISTAFSSPIKAGNLIVVTTCDDSGTNTGVTGVTDSLGNVYTQIFATHGTSSIQMWYAILTLGGSSVTVNVSWNTGTTPGVTYAAQEFSGIHPTKPLGNFAISAAATSTTPTSPALANDQAVSLIVAGGIHAGVAAAWTLGTGYTNLNTVDVTNRSMGQESKVVANIASNTAAFTIASSLENMCAIAIFNGYVVSPYRHITVGDGMSRSEVAF